MAVFFRNGGRCLARDYGFFSEGKGEDGKAGEGEAGDGEAGDGRQKMGDRR